MRTFNFAVAMTAFVCLASAQQDLDLEQDDFDLDEAEQEEQRKLDEYVNDPSFDQQDDEDYESDGASEDLLSDEDSDDGAPVDDQPTGRRLQSRRQRRNRVQRANRQRTPRTTNDTNVRPQRVPCRERATGPEFGCWFASDNYQAQNRGDKLD